MVSSSWRITLSARTWRTFRASLLMEWVRPRETSRISARVGSMIYAARRSMALRSKELLWVLTAASWLIYRRRPRLLIRE